MDQLSSLLIGGAVGLLPLLFSALLSWMEKRGQDARQDQALRLAQRRVQFIRSWWRVRQAVSSPEELEQTRRELSDELDRIDADLRKVWTDNQERRATRARERNILQRLFLTYVPRTALAWLWHILFYVGLSLTAFLVLVGFTSKEASPSLTMGLAILAIPVLLLMVVVRSLARRADRRALRKTAEAEG